MLLFESDITELIKFHNRPWSSDEILVFLPAFIATSFICLLLIDKNLISVKQAMAVEVLLIYVAIVFASTVFTRDVEPARRYHLDLFWSWKKYAETGDWKYASDNILNIILFVPIGVLIPVIIKTEPRIIAILSGVMMSLAIEVLQFVLKRGLFEWDDIIHNVIGCVIGCELILLFMKIMRRIRVKKS